MPRQRMWTWRKVSSEDISAGLSLVDRFMPQNKAAVRLITDRDSFMFANNFNSWEVAVMPLVGQMYRDGLKVSTIKSYLQIMSAGFSTKAGPVRRVFRALAKAAASVPARKALAISSVEAGKLIQELRLKSMHLSACGLEFMFRTGLRVSEIVMLRRDDVCFAEDAIYITVRVGKNVLGQTHVSRIKLEHKLFFGRPSRQLVESWRSSKRGCPFGGWSVDKAIKMMQCTQVGSRKEGTRTVSTYSLRRLFIRRAMVICQGNEVECARRYTRHKNPLMIRAYYDDMTLVEQWKMDGIAFVRR